MFGESTSDDELIGYIFVIIAEKLLKSMVICVIITNIYSGVSILY
jgi:hypothetical protein